MELVQWVNDVLQLSINKVEEMGKGDAYCQLLDSLFHDIPLRRVKYNSKLEIDYIQNFKIVQASFIKHNIKQHIPVDRLTKLKFQDNLEFLQWFYKFWTSSNTGEYNPVESKSTSGRTVKPSSKPVKAQAKRVVEVQDSQVTELKLAIDTLEKERDFYFSKLRDVEIVIQGEEELPVVKKIQQILYSTEEGFEAPKEEETF